MKTPRPDEFPITIERALRLAVGGRDEPERFRVFRAWWKTELARVSKITGVITDNTDEMVRYFKQNGVDRSWLNSFCAGIAQFKAAQRSERMSNLAKTRWQKPNAKGMKKSFSRGRK